MRSLKQWLKSILCSKDQGRERSWTKSRSSYPFFNYFEIWITTFSRIWKSRLYFSILWISHPNCTGLKWLDTYPKLYYYNVTNTYLYALILTTTVSRIFYKHNHTRFWKSSIFELHGEISEFVVEKPPQLSMRYIVSLLTEHMSLNMSRGSTCHFAKHFFGD